MKLRSNIYHDRCLIGGIVLSFYSYIYCPNFVLRPISVKRQKQRLYKATETANTVLVTFIEIGAAKCIPCKAMQPIMKEVAEEYKGQVNVIFHDVWTLKGKEDAMKYNIRIIPTQVFLDKNGKEYYRHEGYFPKEEVVKIIKMQGVK